jgi:hypothetical protein
MFSYLFTFLMGLVGYAVFAAFFPQAAAKITEIQNALTTWVKAKFAKKT